MNSRVLITAHSGCDVERVARLLHQRSRRSRAPVVAVTCAGVSDRRLESELFGEVVSGSAGAPQRRPSLAELADGGPVHAYKLHRAWQYGLEYYLDRPEHAAKVTKTGG